ncbi:uncharacterized protein EKO05_0008291 [Ascochyta rabiei]|uniref:Exodeoxyribonuclease VII n=1 Tax=Didymella rabiei TaxID=5454 RepID=A0A163DLE9_DIDRA|nr:uncharacterized protein EKO05_0008291 [Ascochyta rabiei]KZM23235.1 exodeoxyribonuclease VII [Ascochyta rabiei]UPX17968.1 hypothetical protein EKO05_0008291 [Ascochyta rabiei]
MSHEHNGAPAPRTEAEFAEAIKELARGERTASALERHLDSLERKIEELLAQAEKAERDMHAGAASTSGEPPSRDKAQRS